MTLDKEKEVQAEMDRLSQYYTKIDFPRLASVCQRASDSLKRLIEAIEAVEETKEGIDV